MKIKTVCLLLFIVLFSFLSGQNPVKISSDFPGGNISVTKISNDTVWLKPDLSFTDGEWFYWYFKISEISGKQITFQFEKNNVFARYGPAYSVNNNETWKWYGENRVTNNSFSFSFLQEDTIAFFSMGFPYTEKNLNDFLKNLNSDELIIDTLCFSQENRVIEKIKIPSLNSEPENRVLITARHHACEMMANYVIEGIIKSLINDKGLQELREKTEFLIIPFIDKDGVENGEQGKNRIPRDHNRDYGDNSIYPSTVALKKLIPEWSGGKLRITLDIHCPWISGKHNEDIYLVGSSDKQNEQNQIIFSQLLEKNSFGEIKSYHENFLPFGTAWNTGKNYTQGMTFTRWAGGIDGIKLSASVEYPYSNISGIMAEKDNSRVFGETISHSINEFLKITNEKQYILKLIKTDMNRIYLVILLLIFPLFLVFSAGNNIFIEAESFQNKGGWLVDQQFSDLMGSTYLIAHGMGVPVADAETTVKFPSNGEYNIFVRTFNWTSLWFKGEGPGKFQLLVKKCVPEDI